ncbi:MAG: sugar phosphate isomerase/epimerase, partial [Gammaproteobacteria bacterium]|nr:sugar phosphate isomerase/epimerase [Gammaproteobacteria bacterium]
PDMFVDTMERFDELLDQVDDLFLTLDIGHLHCQGEIPITAQIERWASRIINVHIEDMKRGVHEHLMFGKGEISFPPILQALVDVAYQGPVHVELSRHSHDGPDAAGSAYEFMQPLIESAASRSSVSCHR